MNYSRILLKLSGEAFSGHDNLGISKEALAYAIREIKVIHTLKVEAALVIGGGNFLRGSQTAFLDRAVADQMGMLATIMNGLALAEALHQEKIPALLQSAVATPWTDPIQPARAKKALANGEVVIFAGGTGNPFVTTDTAAAIRASEIGADALLKATQVDGVYSADPKKDSNAKRFERVGYDQAIKKNLAVMDMAAFDLCRQNRVPIIIFDFYKKGNLNKIVLGQSIGTLVS
ncbi:UMP kinase [Candidatus Acetothermia bacterium]|nr:UMP kinase [Candidatus Acetothermia bacterium]MBI3643737.1 UMP kinase [Candidatus Acetothermia bacterium]